MEQPGELGEGRVSSADHKFGLLDLDAPDAAGPEVRPLLLGLLRAFRGGVFRPEGEDCASGAGAGGWVRAGLAGDDDPGVEGCGVERGGRVRALVELREEDDVGACGDEEEGCCDAEEAAGARG